MSTRLPTGRHTTTSLRRVAQVLSAATALALIVPSGVQAHEGHAPLPSKGVLVDAEQGLIVLSAEAREALAVKTAEVELLPVDESVLAYATLQTPWIQHAYATTRIAGRISKLHVEPGQRVEAGDVLAEVRSLELENLQLELLNAQSDVELSARTLERVEPLARTQAVAGRQLLEARSKHRENLNALRIARGKLLSLGLTDQDIDGILHEGGRELVGTLPILSPVAGTVTHTDLAVGRVVDPSEHLFEILDLSKVWVRIGVLERDLHRIRTDQPVTLTLAAYPREVFRTAVRVKGHALDPDTHLGTVWAELGNPAGVEPRLLPGMRGRVRITVSKPEKLVAVPAAAVISDGAERYVLVEEAATSRASEYRKQNVVVELITSRVAYIRDGDVFPGDRVVTAGSHELGTSFVQGVLRPSPEAAKNIGLQVAPARRQVVEEVVELDGAVELPPGGRALASSQLTGTLQRILVDRDQPVRAGEVIAEIASLELQDMQLGLLRAHLQAGLLEETLAQLRSLDASQVLARRQLQEAENQYTTALNEREAARRKLEAVGVSRRQIEAILAEGRLLTTLPLRAPVDGVVIDFQGVLGQVVSADEPLFEIHDLSRAWVRGYLSERDLASVRIGQAARVRLTADPAFVGEGKVVRSGRRFGSDDRTLSVWVEFSQQPEAALQPEMLARLTLTVNRPEPTLAVPAEAVVREGTQAYVFVQEPDGSFQRRPVETGRAGDLFVEITRGLDEGEVLAVQGTAGLQTAYAAVR